MNEIGLRDVDVGVGLIFVPWQSEVSSCCCDEVPFVKNICSVGPSLSSVSSYGGTLGLTSLSLRLSALICSKLGIYLIIPLRLWEDHRNGQLHNDGLMSCMAAFNLVQLSHF